MFDILPAFKNENEGYITIPAMKHFLKSKNLKIGEDRSDMLTSILEYAYKSQHNENDVLIWLDSVLREGQKEIHVKRIRLNRKTEELFSSDEKVEALFNPHEKDSTNHVSTFSYSPTFSYIKHEISNTKIGQQYSVILGKQLYCQNPDFTHRVIPYIVIIDIYPDISFIIGRAKPKANLYKYDGKAFDPEQHRAIEAGNLIEEAITKVVDLLGCEELKKAEAVSFFGNSLYNIVEEYTQTPDEIRDILETKQEMLNDLVRTYQTEFCLNSVDNHLDVTSDVRNLAEKYLSVNWPDTDIFTRGRRAYPTKLSATDEEESKVDQRSGLEKPLQSKSIFFDNKRTLEKNRSCDSAQFCYNRANTKYFGPDFKVAITISRTKNYITVKFPDYTQEEDIQDVLLEVIKSGTNPVLGSDKPS